MASQAFWVAFRRNSTSLFDTLAEQKGMYRRKKVRSILGMTRYQGGDINRETAEGCFQHVATVVTGGVIGIITLV